MKFATKAKRYVEMVVNCTGYVHRNHIPIQYITFKSVLMPASSHTYIISLFDLMTAIELGNVYEQGARVILDCMA
jgi:hypothetical protein